MNYIVVMSPLMAKILADAPFIEADVTFDETREYPYMFNVTAFDTVTTKWVVVCRIRITKQTQDAYAMCFRLLSIGNSGHTIYCKFAFKQTAHMNVVENK